MKKILLTGCLLTCFLMISTSFISMVQAVEVKEEVKSILDETCGVFGLMKNGIFFKFLLKFFLIEFIIGFLYGIPSGFVLWYHLSHGTQNLLSCFLFGLLAGFAFGFGTAISIFIQFQEFGFQFIKIIKAYIEIHITLITEMIGFWYLVIEIILEELFPPDTHSFLNHYFSRKSLPY